MALVAIQQIRPARAAPGDIFDVAAPALTDSPQATAPIADGDGSVSEQTGAFQYSYPIRVAPGRAGMQPRLALSYSSQTPIYGGIAAGWSLSIPIITLCAFIVLNIFLTHLHIVFWWLFYIKICLPFPKPQSSQS